MMKVNCAHTKLVDIDLLVSNPKNPNKHPDNQIQLLAKIMKHQGWRSPIVVSKRSGFITKGHGRLMAAKLNGWTECPVDEQDYANEADEYADMVADNKIAELSETDLSMVNKDVMDLGPDFDLDLLGIPDFVLEPTEKLEPGCDEDEVPESTETRTKLGDLYKLGNHRLLCGDSTNTQHIDLLMDGQRADMVFTDPPYGMKLDTDYSKLPNSNRKGIAKAFQKIIGDNDDFKAELIQTCLGVFGECREIFLFGADYYAELLPSRNDGSWIVWDKRVTENFDKMIGSAFELCWSKQKHKREICRQNNTLFSGESDAKNKVHPTQKPIKVIEWFFERWGKPQDSVVDLFGGSGSTLIACEKTNRKCFMMEISPEYCDVIIARWEKYTGKKAELINGTT